MTVTVLVGQTRLHVPGPVPEGQAYTMIDVSLCGMISGTDLRFPLDVTRRLPICKFCEQLAPGDEVVAAVHARLAAPANDRSAGLNPPQVKGPALQEVSV